MTCGPITRKMAVSQTKNPVTVFGNRIPKKSTQKGGCLVFALIIFNIILMLCGGVCIGIGIWMKVDQYVSSYFTIVAYDPRHSVLHAATTIFLIIGFTMIGIGLLGIYAGISMKKKFLMAYGGCLILVLTLEIIAGGLAWAFRERIYYYLRDSMRRNLQLYYDRNTGYGQAWDFVQVRMKCCAASESADYKGSIWYSNNVRNGEPDKYVPPTCCRLQPHQDRDVSRVDPKDARPQNERGCQKAAHGNTRTEDIHGSGCFVTIHWWVWQRSTVILGLGISIGLMQILGLFACILLIRKSEQ